MTTIVLRPQKLDENKRSDQKNQNQKAPKMTEFRVKAKRRRDRTDGQTTGRATYRRGKKRVSHSPAAFAVRRSRARREMALIGRAFYISSRHYNNSCMSLTIWDAVCGIIRSCHHGRLFGAVHYSLLFGSGWMCLEELFCACPSRTDHVWPPRQLSRMEVFSDLVVSPPEAKKRAELSGNVQEKDSRDEGGGGVLRRRGALFGARQNGARRRDFDRRIVVSDKGAKRSRTSSLIIIDRPCFSASLFLLLRVSPPPLRIMTIRIKKNAQIPKMHPSHA